MQAADLLNKGVNLNDVTARLGYQTPEWVHKLARATAATPGRLPWPWRSSRRGHAGWRAGQPLRSVASSGVTDRDRANLASRARYGK